MSQGNYYQYNVTPGYEAAYSTPVYGVNTQETVKPNAPATNAGNYYTEYGYAHTSYTYPQGNYPQPPQQPTVRPPPAQTAPTVRPPPAPKSAYPGSSNNATRPQNIQQISVIGQPRPKPAVTYTPSIPAAKPAQTSSINNANIKAVATTAPTSVPQPPISQPATVSQNNQALSKRAPKVNLSYYCDLCNIQCGGPQPFQNHMNGKNHKKKEASTVGSTSGGSLHCEICSVTCTSAPTYEAHMNGAKHKKTVKLQTHLKPASSDVEMVSAEGKSSTPDSAEGKKDNDESSNKNLVGQDYIEEVVVGKVFTIHCKLCDCNFTDRGAKDVHLKGRKHRLAYKKKVDPSIVVEPAPSVKKSLLLRRERFPFPFEKELEMMRAGFPPLPFPGPFNVPMDNLFIQDDKYVVTKNSELAPLPEHVKSMGEAIGDLEKSLKLISVELTEARKIAKAAEEKEPATEKATTEEKEPATVKTEESKKSEVTKAPLKDLRVLKGVMRVGDFAKGLLLKGEIKADLVVLCAEKPTVHMLNGIAEKLPKHLEATTRKYSVIKDIKNAAIIISGLEQSKAQVTLTLTSPEIRSDTEGDTPNPPNMLDPSKCLEALAAVRRVRWFMECAANGPCPMIIRVVKDFCRRVPTWMSLESWPMELLVEKTINSLGKPVSPGESLRYIFEAVASGILLPDGPGLQDPCEKEPLDANRNMTTQQREDITSSAQHALRLTAFSEIYKVLAMEKFPNSSEARKRKNESTAADEVIIKKEKIDESYEVIIKQEPLDES